MNKSNNINNNKNYSYINNRDNEYLFKKIIKNVYLWSLISKYLKIYNIFYKCRKINVSDLVNKETIEFYNDVELIIQDDIDLEKITPVNIESMTLDLSEFRSQKSSISIPSSVKSLGILNNNAQRTNNRDFTDILSFLSNLKIETLSISSKYNNTLIQINPNFFPSSLTELDLSCFGLEIKKGTLPNTLRKLTFSKAKNNSIEKGSLPPSLKELIVNEYSSKLTQNSMIKLNIDRFQTIFPIESGYLPDGLEVLKLNNNFYDDSFNIHKFFIFPSNLQYLEIKLKSFNFKLPSSLKTLIMEMDNDNLEISSEMIPYGLTSLECNFSTLKDSDGISIFPDTLTSLVFKNKLFNERLEPSNLPQNLLYLEFTYPSIFDNGSFSLSNPKTFPPSLTYIDFGNFFNQTIGANVLPPFLNTLIFGDFYDQEIGINVLPSSLKILKIGYNFYQDILTDSIPFNLELLEIRNRNYKKPIKLKNRYTLVDLYNYYKQFEQCPEELYVYKVPYNNYNTLVVLSLKNKINLEYLDLKEQKYYQYNIEDDLPITSIKTLVLGINFQQTIDLEQFNNLETIYINDSNPKINTTIYTSNIDNNVNYNFFNLKSIIVPATNLKFLDNIDKIFYQYITLTK
ncbi:hypothetical protein DICPUDRAFT_77962 [Dictyostelium purpureum]|uniref:FNIP repeat-containing protein n=1 Tax=Dictyostelium purpureum TaxID=5786 RepID=F0ZI53_DICPU|nr:uncharacterized protein DICPUDRAFT_77962 [Dictyostelium purpureum]EGC36386.1 hypothetical protein DICPUDRAFT_77962 [Dictyostelium purpureum]|eukprot:XP_003287083.1 hypothetical protein DICPUDRAFT_77962 [Dictyostelium purpureum]